MTRTQREQSIILREQLQGKRPHHGKVRIIKSGATIPETKQLGSLYTANQPYPKGWTVLRREIRKRDSNTCQLCHSLKRLHVHHIDYTKENCNPLNLITLCIRCHHKTSFHRQSWYRMLSEKMRAKYH